MLPELFLFIFIAWVVIYADFKITASNVGSKFNGVGCVHHVLRAEINKPMQYRVLVPYLCGVFKGIKHNFEDYLTVYTWIKQVFIILSLASCWIWFNVSGINPFYGICLLAAFYIIAALYDYTDIYAEMFLFSLAFTIMTLQPEWDFIVLGAIGLIAGLNRETAVFIPFTMLFMNYELVTISIVLFSVICGLMIPIIKYGERERYCSFFMVGENFKRMIELLKKNPPILLNDYVKFFTLLGLTIYLYWNSYMTVGLSAVDISMGVFFLLILIPSIWSEIRVFTPVMLAVIPMVLRGI